jgi:putative addiction module component (TIGR02574 family)
MSAVVMEQLLEATQLLTVTERVQLAQAIWESIPVQPADWRPSQGSIEEIRRRSVEYRHSPDSSISAGEMATRLQSLRATMCVD